MATNHTNTTIYNTNDPNQTLITINVAAQTPLKLTTTNYISWKLQFQTLFVGYDLLGYIDGSKPCPSPTITTNNTTEPNPAYLFGFAKTNSFSMQSLVRYLLQSFRSLPMSKTRKKHETYLLIPILNRLEAESSR